MNNAKNFNKVWTNSLCFLDNNIVHCTITVILILYCSTIFDNINSFIGNLYNYSIIKLIVLLLIVYIAKKDTIIAVLLALSYAISLNYTINNEYFSSSGELKQNIINKINSKKDNEESFDNKNKNRNIKRDKYIKDEHLDLESFDNKENFFPGLNINQNIPPFEPVKNNTSKEVNKNSDYDKTCNQTYTPMFESVGDVCSPVATFNDELNAQGLNYPEGYNSPVYGSPLNTPQNTPQNMPQKDNIKKNIINTAKELNKNIDYDKTCNQTYTPMFESVGDVCSPTSTFKDELNAQGLNYPEGFNSPVYGSPL